MPMQLDWNLAFPIQDDVLPNDMIVVKSRGTSGAGQFEIAGSASTSDGTVLRARDFVEKSIRFELPAPLPGAVIRFTEEYPVQEVGDKVRVSVQSDGVKRPNIGNLFAAAFMLPEVSSRAKAIPFSDDDLGEKTYWIDDVGCRVISITDKLVELAPEEFIFATSNKDDASQVSAMARFNQQQRLERLYELCLAGARTVHGPVQVAFQYYLGFLTGNVPFEYQMASYLRGYLMKWLGSINATYQPGADPLLALTQEISQEQFSGHSGRTISKQPHNLIYFGAPGTGKSYELNKAARESFPEENISRVTFYPDYTYSQFVGCFKPVTRYEEPDDTSAAKTSSYISYEFVPGPFLSSYMKAVQNPCENHLLIVEEINRANPAAVFGDIFQLLDRKATGESEYEIAVPSEMESFLKIYLPEYATSAYISDPVKLSKERERLRNESKRLALPRNLYIWATMNSADQGVSPMDTAFKRRWDFRYIGIDAGEDARIDTDAFACPLSSIEVSWGCNGEYRANWNKLRKALNEFLVSDKIKLNEDKLLGPFFVKPEALAHGSFAAIFKDKVLLYLYEDACRTKRSKLFASDLKTYSQICDAFDRRGVGVFSDDFKNYYLDGDDGAKGNIETEE